MRPSHKNHVPFVHLVLLIKGQGEVSLGKRRVPINVGLHADNPQLKMDLSIIPFFVPNHTLVEVCSFGRLIFFLSTFGIIGSEWVLVPTLGLLYQAGYEGICA